GLFLLCHSEELGQPSLPCGPERNPNTLTPLVLRGSAMTTHAPDPYVLPPPGLAPASLLFQGTMQGPGRLAVINGTMNSTVYHCLRDILSHPCFATSIESPKTVKNAMIPREYHELREVFSKDRATQLPPHHPWDCAIDLLPNAMPPKCKVYPLCLPEIKAMEEYIEEALTPWGSSGLQPLRQLSAFSSSKRRMGPQTMH
ncbi:hypothetical protein QTP70_025874, partial [Hemibagrus guttatus]